MQTKLKSDSAQKSTQFKNWVKLKRLLITQKSFNFIVFKLKTIRNFNLQSIPKKLFEILFLMKFVLKVSENEFDIKANKSQI